MPARSFGPLNTGRVLGGMALLLLPVALFAPKGVAPLFAVSAMLVFALTFDTRRIGAILRQPVAVGLTAFLAIAATSAIWSIEPASSLRATLILALTSFGGLYLADTIAGLKKEPRKTLCLGIIAGGVLGLFLIVFERSTGAFLTREILLAKNSGASLPYSLMPGLNGGMSVLALFIWPWALAVKNHFGTIVMALGLLASVVVIFLSSADAPILALMAGMIVAALSLISRKTVLALTAALAVTGIALAPLLPGALPNPHTEARVYSKLSNSGVHRLAIWRTAAEHIANAPAVGIGMNATRFLYGRSDRVYHVYATDDPQKKWGNYAEPIPLHTHNGVLQIWLELGAIGALSFAGVLVMVMWRIRQGFDDAVATAARLGMMISGITMFSLSFGPWQGWWQGAIWLSVALMSMAEGVLKEQGNHSGT